MTRAISGLIVLFGAILVSACGLVEDETPDYRYRLTVEVDTPEGLKTGSSVIEVRQSMGRSAGSGYGKMIIRRIRGEAVAVDLPNGQTLFALLRSERDGQWASQVMQRLAPTIEGEPWEEVFDNVLLVEGKVELPAQGWPEKLPDPGFDGYPMMVTFGDVDDPTSVERVDPDDLTSSFGDGVSLKHVTVELTDEPVTTGIERRLGWLDGYVGRLVQRSNRDSGTEKPVEPRILRMHFLR